jgi:hypothetical protein
VLLIGLVLGLLRLIYFLAVQAKNSAQKATVPGADGGDATQPQKVLSAAKANVEKASAATAEAMANAAEATANAAKVHEE